MAASDIVGGHVHDGQEGTVLGNCDSAEVVLELGEVDVRVVLVKLS